MLKVFLVISVTKFAFHAVFVVGFLNVSIWPLHAP
jgi:hypothetical protein